MNLTMGSKTSKPPGIEKEAETRESTNNLLVLNAGNGWEWGNGMTNNSDYRSFPHSLLSTSKIQSQLESTPSTRECLRFASKEDMSQQTSGGFDLANKSIYRDMEDSLQLQTAGALVIECWGTCEGNN